jgi:hypothetical protein
LLAWVASACGRIEFDTRGAAGDAGSDASDDAGMACTPFDTDVAANGAIGLAWTGSTYLMLTVDGLASVDPTTGALGTTRALSPPEGIEYGGGQALAWNGSELALVWLASTGALEFGFTDATGTGPITAQQLVAGNAIDPHVAWTGADFVVAWIDTSMSRVLFDQITASGQITHNGDIFQDGSAIGFLYGLDCDTAHCVAAIYHAAAGNPSLVVEPLPLGGTSAENALALPSSGVYMQLVPASSGGFAVETTNTGGFLQAYDASDVMTGSSFAVPGTMGQGLGFVSGIETGTGPRLYGVTNGTPTYVEAVDYLATSQTFSQVVTYDSFTVSTTSAPAITSRPSGMLFAAPYTVGGTGHVRLHQDCM